MTPKEWEARYLREEGSNYDRDFRYQFVSDYLLNPNLTKIAEKHKVPYQTAFAWKSKVWWAEMTEEILRNHNEDLLSRQRKILDKTYNELQDRLENGDAWHVNGQNVRVPVRANHLATIADTTLKANQLLQGKATQIHNVTIENLADKLRTITDQALIKDITPEPIPLESPKDA